MTDRMIVKVERTFQAYTAGDILIVDDTPNVRALIAARLFTVDSPPTPAAEAQPPPAEKPKPKAKPAKPAKAKKKPDKKPAAKAGK